MSNQSTTKEPKKKGKAVRKILAALGILLAAFLLVVAYLWFHHPAAPAATINNPNGYVQAVGNGIYDGDGNLLTLKGVNLGDWLVQECYMTVSSVGDFDGGAEYTTERGMRAMEANPNLTADQIEELEKLYLDTFIQEQDFQNIKDLGLNAVRIVFSYRNFTDVEGNLKEDAFHYLDWALDMCDKYGIYAILDQHGAYGSQNQDQHSGDDTQFNLYGNEKNEQLTIKLWEVLAERYKDRKCVAAYDLLNECRRAAGQFGGKVNTDFYDVLYKAIRAIDPNHMISIGYFTFPIHGGRLSNYDWENVMVEYHIYNQTPVSMKTALGFYNALNNFMGVDVPVYIGEWNGWDSEDDCQTSIDTFNANNWSYTSWCYKANAYLYPKYQFVKYRSTNNWGVYETDLPTVDLSTATYEEIAAVYAASGTENARTAVGYDVYMKNK